MKYLYCYLGKFIEWETDKDRSLETYRYCDLTNVSRFSQRDYVIDISEVSLLSPIEDFRPGEMFLTDESLFNSYNHTTFNLSFSEYSDVLASLKVYRDMVFKDTGRYIGRFDKWQVSNDCVGVLDDYIIEKKRDLKIDLVLDFL
jgi:hypothetical protein